MTARLFPFPAARRVKLIRTTAAQIADCTHGRGEQAIARTLETQRLAMARKGIPADLIQQEIRSLELAIRAQLWSIVMRNGGAA